MATLKYLPQYFSTKLNVGGGIDDSQTTGIVLLDVSGVDIAKPGQICISYSDPLDTSIAEWIDYTSINGSNELVGVTRGREGYSAHSHLQDASVAFVLSASHHNDIVDLLNGTEAGIKVKTALYDANGNEVIKTPATTSAVNEVTITNSATGNSPSVSATGGDDNLDLLLVSKGTGVVKANGVAVATGTVPVKASGAEVTTGTDDAKFATAKALADAGVNTRLKSKIITATRDMTGADGDVAYTGVGFQPTAVFALAAINGTIQYSIGAADSSATEINLYNAQASTNVSADNTFLAIWAAGGGAQTGALKQFDADGFTITWTKYLTPTGTVTMKFLCFR